MVDSAGTPAVVSSPSRRWKRYRFPHTHNRRATINRELQAMARTRRLATGAVTAAAAVLLADGAQVGATTPKRAEVSGGADDDRVAGSKLLLALLDRRRCVRKS
jgi:hypothetical protein